MVPKNKSRVHRENEEKVGPEPGELKHNDE